MKDSFYLDPIPCSEESAGVENSSRLQRLEARAMIAQVERTFGPFPEGFGICRNWNSHEYGTYVDLQIWFLDPEEGESISRDFACRVEAKWPEFWDREAIEFLIKNGYPSSFIQNQESSKSA